MNSKQHLGTWGETMAINFLVRHGFTVVERNWRCQEGEIDIVASKGGEWWFVEVKTRVSLAAGEPEESCDETKLNRMEDVALDYLAYKNVEIDSWQLALVSVKVIGKKKAKLYFAVL